MRPFRKPAAYAAGLMLVLALPLATASADVVRFKYVANGEDTIGSLPSNRFITPGSFGCSDAGAGVCSSATDQDSLNARLPTGPDGAAENSGAIDVDTSSTTTPGVLVHAFSTLGPLTPSVGPGPVRARTELFANHVQAATSHHLFFADDLDLRTFFSSRTSFGEATSTWFDTWTALGDGTVTADFRLDGRVSDDRDPCEDVLCLPSFPPGTHSSLLKNSDARLNANLAIFDLDTLLLCEVQFGDNCDGNESLFEQVVALIGAEITLPDVTGPTDLAVDLVDSITFNAIVGHRYFTIVTMTATSSDGGVVDFMNTFALTRFDDPLNVIESQAERELGALLPRRTPTTAVPAPAGTSLLLAAGLGALITLRRRTVRSC